MSLTPTERRESATAVLLRFRSNEAIAVGTRRILAHLTEEMATILDDPTKVGADATIHRVRRHGKQARALLRLVRPAIRDDFKSIDRLYRDAGRLLAPARDARIVVNALDELAIGGDALTRLRSALDHRAKDEARRVFSGEASAAGDAQRLVTDAAVASQLLEIPDEPSSIADGATRIYTAGQRAYRKAARDKTYVAFHTWRKRVKQRRHHMAFLWDLSPMDPADHDRLYELSDLLGAAHDLVVVRDHVAAAIDASAKAEADEVLRAADTMRWELEAKSLRLGESLFSTDATEIHDALVANWSEWRST